MDAADRYLQMPVKSKSLKISAVSVMPCERLVLTKCASAWPPRKRVV